MKQRRSRRSVGLRALALILLAGLGGCDKCGHRISIDAPSIQHACGDQPDAR